MKKSILLLTTSLAVAIGGFIFLNDDTVNEPVKRSYHLAELNQNDAKSQNWNDAYEIYHQLYADVNTGEILGNVDEAIKLFRSKAYKNMSAQKKNKKKI